MLLPQKDLFDHALHVRVVAGQAECCRSSIFTLLPKRDQICPLRPQPVQVRLNTLPSCQSR